jgi:hypothetical protein
MGQGDGDIEAPGAAPTESRDAPGRPDVFISYAWPDIAVADAVCAALERAVRGDRDDAFQWLDRALENGETQPSLMRSDPSLRSLQADPRFDALLRKMKLL